MSQSRNYLLYFICCDDKIKPERPIPLWAQILEGLTHDVKHRTMLGQQTTSIFPLSETFYSQLFRVILAIILSNFIVLGNWTEQGIKNVAESPERVKATRKMIEKAGGKMQFFTTMGKYDFVLLVEIPKDEDIAAILLCTGSLGNIRTITMKAWTEAEATKLLTAPHA
jgi:uncharacterized protein with GYD domain